MDASTPLPLRLGPLENFRGLLERSLWQELEQQLPEHLWIFDRPYTPAQFRNALEELLGTAIDIKLLVLTMLKQQETGEMLQAGYTCCLLWGERGSWNDHELEFDLHLGYKVSAGDWKLSYLGILPARPEEVPFPGDT
jgi:hypothetical protein